MAKCTFTSTSASYCFFIIIESFKNVFSQTKSPIVLILVQDSALLTHFKTTMLTSIDFQRTPKTIRFILVVIMSRHWQIFNLKIRVLGFSFKDDKRDLLRLLQCVPGDCMYRIRKIHSFRLLLRPSAHWRTSNIICHEFFPDFGLSDTMDQELTTHTKSNNEIEHVW